MGCHSEGRSHSSACRTGLKHFDAAAEFLFGEPSEDWVIVDECVDPVCFDRV
jgi:hypothetical protein